MYFYDVFLCYIYNVFILLMKAVSIRIRIFNYIFLIIISVILVATIEVNSQEKSKHKHSIYDLQASNDIIGKDKTTVSSILTDYSENEIFSMSQEQKDNYFMGIAIKQAQESLKEGGTPIGSVLVSNDKIIGQGHNLRIQTGSPIQHGEMNAIDNAGRLTADIYYNSTIYTTLSPCQMCSGTIGFYNIPRVVIGDNINFKDKYGEDVLIELGHDVKVLNDEVTINMMKDFISSNPSLWNEDIGKTDYDTNSNNTSSYEYPLNNKSIISLKQSDENIISYNGISNNTNSEDLSNNKEDDGLEVINEYYSQISKNNLRGESSNKGKQVTLLSVYSDSNSNNKNEILENNNLIVNDFHTSNSTNSKHDNDSKNKALKTSNYFNRLLILSWLSILVVALYSVFKNQIKIRNMQY